MPAHGRRACAAGACSGADGRLHLRSLIAAVDALPLWLDMDGCLALRPGSEIVSFTWDSPADVKVEDDPRRSNAHAVHRTTAAR